MCKLPNQRLASAPPPQGQELEEHLLRCVHVRKAQICHQRVLSTLALNESFCLQQHKTLCSVVYK